MEGMTLNIQSLIMASILVLIALFFSAWQKLKLEKDIIVGTLRAVIQLTAVGFILNYIFSLDNWLFTTLMMIFMVYNASRIAGKRGKGIEKSRLIAFVSIGVAAGVTLAILVGVGAIKYVPSEVIPVSGMVIGNAMVAVGLCFRQMKQQFSDRAQEVEIKLSLGASEKMASMYIIRDSIRLAMQPTIDSMKTLGIVSLPGMMTGLILAGTPPIKAIQYQIMVTFMLTATVSISTFMAGYIAYRNFFNEQRQLKL